MYKTISNLEKFRLFVEPKSTVITNMIVTFIEAAVATWSATGFAVDKLSVAAAVGAGLSAVWNLVLKPYLVKTGWL